MNTHAANVTNAKTAPSVTNNDTIELLKPIIHLVLFYSYKFSSGDK
ncbi:MAG: hypothetical protein NTW69_01085 [Chloroflexi bacterium]|nr:hypothetical protein [Chloroflexota bacterium]